MRKPLFKSLLKIFGSVCVLYGTICLFRILEQANISEVLNILVSSLILGFASVLLYLIFKERK